jgi:shikimate dehydrogenase
MKAFGIIGFPLTSSFSKNLFNEKFEKEKIKARYDLYSLERIGLFPELIRKTEFAGMNVTIPYKEAVIPYLSALDETAREIGAVNVIRFEYYPCGTLRSTTGYNSDAIGFERSLLPLLKPQHTKALVLGTGGASKAVAYILKKNNIDFCFVSRTKADSRSLSEAEVRSLSEAEAKRLTYADLTRDIIESHPLIINTTPLGMYPPESCPDIPYQYLNEQHLLYDLVYNPEKTVFLAKGEERGASIKNGLEMLHGQAAAAWEIWNK